MNMIDLIIIIPLAWSAYKGFSKGLVITVAGLLALLLGIYGSIKFSDITSSYLVQYVELSARQLQIISFAVTFIIIVVAIHFLARILDKIVKAVALGSINRITGAAFNILKTAFVLSIILVLVDQADHKAKFIAPELKEESLLYQPLAGFAPRVFPYLDFERIKEYVPDTVEL